MKKNLDYNIHDDNLVWGSCSVCGMPLEHPPIKMPSEVIKAKDFPGHYDVTYNMTCTKCVKSLISRRLFGILNPKIKLNKLNPTGVNKWNVNEVRKLKKEKK
jgi:hypothetical protein